MFVFYLCVLYLLLLASFYLCACHLLRLHLCSEKTLCGTEGHTQWAECFCCIFTDWFKYWFHRLRSVFDMWWMCWMLRSYTVHFFNDWMSNKSAITSETQLYYTVHMLLFVTLWNPQMRGVYVKTTTKKPNQAFVVCGFLSIEGVFTCRCHGDMLQYENNGGWLIRQWWCAS